MADRSILESLLGYRSIMDPEQRSQGAEFSRGLAGSLPGTGAAVADVAQRAMLPGMVGPRPSASDALTRLMGRPEDNPRAYQGGQLAGDLGQALLPAMGLLGAGSRGGALAAEAGAIFPKGKQALIDALAQQQLKRPIELGSLEPEALAAVQQHRAALGWPARESDLVRVAPADLGHMLKRINLDKMTPQTVADMAEAVLARGAATGMKDGRVNLLPPEMVVQGQKVRPQGVLVDGDEYATSRLYGITPKGWKTPK